jgi:hypothetical protein
MVLKGYSPMTGNALDGMHYSLHPRDWAFPGDNGGRTNKFDYDEYDVKGGLSNRGKYSYFLKFQ